MQCCILTLCRGSLCQSFGLFLGYRLNGILIMFGTCHFFLARTVVDAEAYHNCTNQGESH